MRRLFIQSQPLAINKWFDNNSSRAKRGYSFSFIYSQGSGEQSEGFTVFNPQHCQGSFRGLIVASSPLYPFSSALLLNVCVLFLILCGCVRPVNTFSPLYCMRRPILSLPSNATECTILSFLIE